MGCLSEDCDTLREQISYDPAMDIGQTKIAASVAEGQPLMIKAENVKDCCMEVMHVNSVFFDSVSNVVGLSIDDS